MAGELIVAGWLDYGPYRDRVLEHFTVVAAASRTEAGCLDYVVCTDPEHPGRLVVFERWASEDDLAAHFRTPHIAAFRAAVRPYPRSGREVRQYVVERGAEFGSPPQG